VAKVVTSKAGGTISQQAVVHPWLAADTHGNKKKSVPIGNFLLIAVVYTPYKVFYLFV
jgi:hypothetical protein